MPYVRQLPDIRAVVGVVQIVLDLHLLLVQMLLQVLELNEDFVVGHVGCLSTQIAWLWHHLWPVLLLSLDRLVILCQWRRYGLTDRQDNNYKSK